MACSRSSGLLLSPTRTAVIALFSWAGERTAARFLAESAGGFPGELQTPRTQPLPVLGADAQTVAWASTALARLVEGKSPYGPGLVALAVLLLIP
ncbi:MAG: hypothetical protein RL385_3512 [Pseudomonadota bacterium]|jgi:hypothetical protein